MRRRFVLKPRQNCGVGGREERAGIFISATTPLFLCPRRENGLSRAEQGDGGSGTQVTCRAHCPMGPRPPTMTAVSHHPILGGRNPLSGLDRDRTPFDILSIFGTSTSNCNGTPRKSGVGDGISFGITALYSAVSSVRSDPSRWG